MPQRTGLFFGSFNPVHVGHLIIAETVASLPDIGQVWFVVSPQNPFKQKKDLLNQYDRLHLVRLAIENNPKLRASSIEFELPVPSYTIDTLAYLHEKHPEREFALIMGEDNLRHFHKWKNYEQILNYHWLLVYPRLRFETDLYLNHPMVKRLEVPCMEISSTYIRNGIKSGGAVRYCLPEPVYEYVSEMGLYK